MAKAGKFLFLFKRCGHVVLINPEGDLIVNPSELTGLGWAGLRAAGCSWPPCEPVQQHSRLGGAAGIGLDLSPGKRHGRAIHLQTAGPRLLALAC